MSTPATVLTRGAQDRSSCSPVHNRRETTLRCLANLRALGAFSWIGVIVVDDGSDDGTGQAVREQYRRRPC